AIEQVDTNVQGVLIFRLGDEWLALPVEVLVEVTPPRTIHRVPHRGGVLAGLVNIRGELHLCARVDQVLGIKPSEEEERAARLLVVRRDTDRWVFAVDEVDQVHRLAPGELTRVPATVGRAAVHLTSGVFTWRERSIGYLDAGRLFEALRVRAR